MESCLCFVGRYKTQNVVVPRGKAVPAVHDMRGR